MERDEILDFLKVIDSELIQHARAGETLDLYLIGRSALVVRYGLKLATKDIDIVHFHGCALERKALELFGKGTPHAERLGFYLELVPQGLPPIPGGYCRRSDDIAGSWQVLRPKQPKPHDLAVTKLSRFHAKDREDLRVLCDSGEVNAEESRKALDSASASASAFAFAADADEDPQRKRAYTSLGIVIEYLEGKRHWL
jgi:Nucleotidyltransferase of unknown function (DUF6036)